MPSPRGGPSGEMTHRTGRAGVGADPEAFDRGLSEAALKKATNAQVKDHFGRALIEVDRLQTLVTARSNFAEQMHEREQMVIADEMRRVEFMDGGAAILPKDTQEGDLIVLPDGRVYKVTDSRGAIMIHDGGA